MGASQRSNSAAIEGGMSVYGHHDYYGSAVHSANAYQEPSVRMGIVTQFNVGLYSATVKDGLDVYVCYVVCKDTSHALGYSDLTILREGDEVIFSPPHHKNGQGIILGKKPTLFAIDKEHTKVTHADPDTKMERRTHFFGNDCYKPKVAPYTTPLKATRDFSTRCFCSNRPTDAVAGDAGFLNQHRCGVIGNLYSTSLVGGGAHIRLFAIENRIRTVADSTIKYTMNGNDFEWHNRRYLSREHNGCLYQEERFGLYSKDQPAFDEADYHEEFYFTKNKEKKQTAKPRILDQEGYYGNLRTRYCLRPDPDLANPRKRDDKPYDPGVMRESVDPSGQYRMAATGMLGFERIGRIPVPHRIAQPWQKEVEEPKAQALKEFKHDEGHPYYRQLEHADRVAYDLKNSYARIDEGTDEFYIPEEDELSNKLLDSYDPGFTDSKTVQLQKYDKRRSGIWQGEDGSIIIRDAWGSEIVMIGGNIQLSCAGNVETLPGKTALTLAGDDIVHKAQNSIDIESADKDVRINAYNNVQVLAGIPDKHMGGITLEASESASPWDGKSPEGGEGVSTSGILLKSKKGSVVTDTENLILRSRKFTSVSSGEEDIDGQLLLSAKNVYEHGDQVAIMSGDSEAALLLSKNMGSLVGDNVIVSGSSSATRISGGKFPVPIMMVDVGDVASQILGSLTPASTMLTDEEKLTRGYKIEDLDKMIFKFRSSSECGTDQGWELDGPGYFTLYQPFWVQVQPKFETLKSATTKEFEDHKSDWEGTDAKNPWPGKDALSSGKYAKLPSGPVNMTDDGFNKARKSVQDSTSVTEEGIFESSGYQIRN